MALSDPQSVTLTGTTVTTLPRIVVDGAKSEYSNPDQTAALVVSHANGRRYRRTVRLNVAKIAADPFSGINQRYSASVYVVVDHPKEGFTNAELKDTVLALSKWLSDTTGANTVRVLGGES